MDGHSIIYYTAYISEYQQSIWRQGCLHRKDLLMIRMWRLTTLLTVCATLGVTKSQPCTICEGGESITNPDQEISLPEGTGGPIPIENCQDLANVAGFVGAGSTDCLGIQSFGELCGCPSVSSEPSDDEELCRLCPNSTIPVPGLNLTEQEREEVDLIIQSSLGENQSLVLSIPRTCEEVDMVLTQFSPNSSFCAASDSIRTSCGCPPPSSLSSFQCRLCPSGYQLRNSSHTLATNIVDSTSLNDIEQAPQLLHGFNFSNETEATCGNLENVVSMGNFSESECATAQTFVSPCGGCSVSDGSRLDDDEERQQEVEMCSLCPYGESTPWPEKAIENFVTPLPNCGGLEAAASNSLLGSDECLLFRSFSRLCGCNMPESSCSICRDAEMTRPDATYAFADQGNVVSSALGDDIRYWEYSCEVFDSLLAPTVEEGSQTCLVFQLRGASCGCPDPRDTIAVVLKRVAAALSLMVSDVHGVHAVGTTRVSHGWSRDRFSSFGMCCVIRKSLLLRTISSCLALAFSISSAPLRTCLVPFLCPSSRARLVPSATETPVWRWDSLRNGDKRHPTSTLGCPCTSGWSFVRDGESQRFDEFAIPCMAP